MEPDQQRTRVVHCRKEPHDIYIGRRMPSFPELRATGWGNPFTERNPTTWPDGCNIAIAAYRQWIAGQPQLLRRLPELRGKTLGCWCAPPGRKGGLYGDLDGRICHGEVLAALADQLD